MANSVREDYELSKYLTLRDGFLYCEGIKLKSLQDCLEKQLKQPSPVFVYSKNQLVDNILAYKSVLDECGLRYKLGYSVKANYNPWVLRTVCQLGCTAVTVSGNETQLAISMGMDPCDLVVNGNGKQRWEIELAVQNDCLLNVDSGFDLKYITEVATRLEKPARILLRLNPNIDSRVHPYLATGLASSKFGMVDEQLDEVLTSISNDKYLDLVGLHCHIGSTIDSVEVFSECVDVMLTQIDYVKNRGFTNMQYINLGGGLGIDYTKHAWRTSQSQKHVESQQVMPTPCDLIKNVNDRLSSQDLCLILEPGRSIIGSAVTLVTKVIGCKENKDTKYIVTDGSMTEVIRPALYEAYHHIELTEPSDHNAPLDRVMYDVVGSVCECADFLGKERWLQTPHEGCGLAVFDVGAYCASMASNYNLKMRPVEVLIDGDEWKIIRQPDKLETLLDYYPHTD